jgi:hypothetical protein
LLGQTQGNLLLKMQILECGGRAPLWMFGCGKSARKESKYPKIQSGVEPPHSKAGGICRPKLILFRVPIQGNTGLPKKQ